MYAFGNRFIEYRAPFKAFNILFSLIACIHTQSDVQIFNILIGRDGHKSRGQRKMMRKEREVNTRPAHQHFSNSKLLY